MVSALEGIFTGYSLSAAAVHFFPLTLPSVIGSYKLFQKEMLKEEEEERSRS